MPISSLIIAGAVCLLFLGAGFALHAKTGRHRIVWREDPTTRAVIGGNQESGDAPENADEGGNSKSFDTPGYHAQNEWLTGDLKQHRKVKFKIASYHKPLRPHTQGKAENDYLYTVWASPFFQYGMTLALEGDSHMHKIRQRATTRALNPLPPRPPFVRGPADPRRKARAGPRSAPPKGVYS